MISECANCLMNTSTDKNIQFDARGYCNYCVDYYNAQKHYKQMMRHNYLHNQIKAIKASKNHPYDCILGISGGTDSSYAAYLLYKAGLKVLLVHCDNGWNTDIAISNLEKIKQKTGFDLYIRKLDVDAFHGVQKSLIKARVVDIEVLSDHVNVASIYEAAQKEKNPWIITGENINTEFFMPKHWVHNKNDLTNIKSINNAFGNDDLSTFPKLGPIKKFYINKKLNVKYLNPLNLIDYNKNKATKILQKEFDWQVHGGKHYESYFTTFYQSYILPNFFNIDKRIPHLSNLICSKVLTKKEAKEILKQPIIEKEKLAMIKDYVLSTLEITESQLKNIMESPIVPHSHYKSHFIYNKNVQHLINTFNLR